MTDDRDDTDPKVGLFPFPVQGSPFPPLYEYVTAPPADPPSDWIETADAHDLVTQDNAVLENRLSALSRFAFPPSPPLDDEGVAARDRRWTSRTIVFATLFLLIFNGASIQNWSRQQTPGWLTSTFQQLSDVWETQISQLGADQPRRTVRATWNTARSQRFIGQNTDRSES